MDVGVVLLQHPEQAETQIADRIVREDVGRDDVDATARRDRPWQRRVAWVAIVATETRPEGSEVVRRFQHGNLRNRDQVAVRRPQHRHQCDTGWIGRVRVVPHIDRGKALEIGVKIASAVDGQPARHAQRQCGEVVFLPADMPLGMNGIVEVVQIEREACASRNSAAIERECERAAVRENSVVALESCRRDRGKCSSHACHCRCASLIAARYLSLKATLWSWPHCRKVCR